MTFKFILVCCFVAVYSALGSYLENIGAIVEPAYWALFGSIEGMLVMAYLLEGSEP